MKFLLIIIISPFLLLAQDDYCATDALTNNSYSRQYYNIGDLISQEDQNRSFDVCHSDGDYDIGSSFKLSDFSGDIILISMNATW